MMNNIKIVILLIGVLVLGGCGLYDPHDVEPSYVGKILSNDGYSSEILPPGRHNQGVRPFWVSRELVQVSTATKTPKESMSMLVADELRLRFDVRVRMSVDRREDVLNALFDTIQPSVDNQGKKRITFHQIYNVYGKMAVREHTRRIVSKYTVTEVQKNYGNISDEIFVSVRDAIKGTPLIVESLSLGNINYPDVVTEAINAVKERDLEILQAESIAARRLVEVQRDLEIAQAEREIELTRARTTRDSNIIIGEGVTPEFLALKQLQTQSKMAENESAVFLPFEAMNSVGAQIRMFSETK